MQIQVFFVSFFSDLLFLLSFSGVFVWVVGNLGFFVLICFGVEDGDGRITGNDALKFFAMSKLSRPELKQVWIQLIVFFVRCSCCILSFCCSSEIFD